MKKLFTLLLVALVGLLPAGAEDVTVTFNFEDYSSLTPSPTTFPEKSINNGPAGTIKFYDGQGQTVTATGIDLTFTSTGTNQIRFMQSSSNRLQFYSPAQFVFEAQKGYTIKSITLANANQYNISTFTVANGNGTLDGLVYTAAESETAVTLQATGTSTGVGKAVVVLSQTSSTPVVENVETTFNFQDYASLDPNPSTMGTVNIGSGPYGSSEYKANGYVSTNNGATITLAGSANNKLYFKKSTPYLYLYQYSTINIKAESGYSIKAVTFTTNYTSTLGYVSPGETCKGTYDSTTGVYTAPEDGEQDITFSANQNTTFYKIVVSLTKTSGGGEEPETHTPTALSYVLNGAEAVAMDNFTAKNIEIKDSRATLSFIDPDGYAYGAAEANITLANNTATELTEYAPADAANVKAFNIAGAGIYNITTSFRNGKGTVTLVKISDPLTDINGNSVATFNWSMPESLDPACTSGTNVYYKTFTANGISADFNPGMAPTDARFVESNGTTVLRLQPQYTITFTAPAGKTIHNVKISGASVSSSNTTVVTSATTSSSNGVFTITPTYETNTVVVKIAAMVEYTYTTVTYNNTYVPTELYYVTNNGKTFTSMDVDDDNDKIFVAKNVTIGEWGKNGTLKFSEAGASFMVDMFSSCGAAAEGEAAVADKATTLYGTEYLEEADWHNFSVAPGIYTVTVSFATGTPVMTLTKTGDIKQPKPTTMFAIIKGLAEPVELTLNGNSFLSKDNVTIGTTMGGESNFYFAESEDIVDGRTYGAAEANTPYNFDEWYNDLTEYAVDANPNRYTIPSGIYSIDVNIENDVFKVRMSKQGDLMPTALSIYNGEELTAMTADTEAKTFTITDYNIGAWGKPGTIKFTTAFMDMMFGDAYACGADTEGATAEAGKEYTMTGKDKMPIAEWYAYTVAEGVYTVTVSFATGKPVMTLTKTADFDQPKPTTMYAVIEGAEQPVQLFCPFGSEFMANDVKVGTAMGQTMTIYFAENSDITTGRTYGAATANEAYDFDAWNPTLTEFAAGTEANKFTIPSGIYSISVNYNNDTPVFQLTKTGELMPASFYIYNGEELTAMEVDAAAQQFTIADYQIGAWETAGSIKFTTAFMDMAFGDVYAAGADTEGAAAEAGKEYTLNGKDKMPVSDWYSFTVAEGVYTVTVSFATGKPVMTLAKTADIEQPKPTTMYAVIGDAEPTLLFAATATDFMANDVTVNEATTLYFAENSVVAEGRTYGAATADEALEVPTWSTPLIEYAAGVEPNKFTLSAGIYSISLNFSDETPTLSVQKTGDVSGIEEIDAADDDAEYYTLQGVRVVNPTTGIYIRVQGNKATKVAIR